mgnify:CR=1 FL=1
MKIKVDVFKPYGKWYDEHTYEIEWCRMHEDHFKEQISNRLNYSDDMKYFIRNHPSEKQKTEPFIRGLFDASDFN